MIQVVTLFHADEKMVLQVVSLFSAGERAVVDVVTLFHADNKMVIQVVILLYTLLSLYDSKTAHVIYYLNSIPASTIMRTKVTYTPRGHIEFEVALSNSSDDVQLAIIKGGDVLAETTVSLYDFLFHFTENCD